MMLADLLRKHREASDRDAIVTLDRVVSWQQLGKAMDDYTEQLAEFRCRRVGFRFFPIPESFAALAAFDQLECDVVLLDSRISMHRSLQYAERLRLAAVATPLDSADRPTLARIECQSHPGAKPGTGDSSVTILTSGTSGEPKAVRHNWRQLARPTRQSDEYSDSRWFLTFRPELYAGLQVILQCFVNRGTLLIPPIDADVSTLINVMRSKRAQYISATPSFWRRVVIFAEPNAFDGCEFRQITLGGEVVDQQILTMLRSRFPDARIVHIYATTELGRCFSVADDRSGFPKRYLDASSREGVELRIEDGELIVRSANRMLKYDTDAPQNQPDSDWFATGDLVEIVGERVYFIGRRSDVINVGGNKVHPLDVERVIRGVAGIQDVRVFGESSSIAGQLVACDIVVDASADQQLVREAIHRECRAELAAPQLPRNIRIVPQIELSPSGKKDRTKK